MFLCCKLTVLWALQYSLGLLAAFISAEPCPSLCTPSVGHGGHHGASHIFLRRDVVGRPRAEWRVKNQAIGPHADITEFLRDVA